MNKNQFCISSILNFLIFLHPMYSQSPAFATDELILMLTQNDSPDEFIQGLSEEYTLLHQRVLFPQLNIHLFKLKNIPQDSLESACLRLMAKEEIKIAQTNHFLTTHRSVNLLPNDSLFQRQWNLHNTGQTGGAPDADVDAPEAWEITTGGISSHGDTLVVAVIDEGFNLSHPDINWRRNTQEIPQNGIDDDENGYIDDVLGWNAVNHTGDLPIDIHGTHISGIISAKGNNRKGVSGISWQSQILPVLGFQPGATLLKAESDVIAAYSYVYDLRKQYNESQGDRGAFIVATNTAFGVASAPEDHPIWCALYDSLGALGIMNMVATPNSNVNIDEQPDVPSNCPSPYLIAVTSTGKNDQRSPRAFGKTHVDIGAPGDSILSTGLGQGYSLLTGTSMATPHVAGAMALMMSAAPSPLLALYKNNPAEYAQIFRQILLSSVDTLADLIDVTASGGRLNLHQAVLGVLDFSDSLSNCPQPYFVKAESLTDSSISLGWKGEENALYRIRIREQGTTQWDSTLSSSSELHLKQLRACTLYEIQVKSLCVEDSSSYIASKFVKTQGCCEAPTITDILQEAVGMAEIRWKPVFAADSYWVELRPEIGLLGSQELLNDTVLVINELEPCTDYSLRLASFCSGTAIDTATYTFRSLGCGICVEGPYCGLKGNTRSIAGSDTEWIDSVSIDGTFFGSGDNGGLGSFFDSLSVLLIPGKAIPIRLVPGFSQAAFRQAWRIWIDLNQNGSFEEPGETVFQPKENYLGPVIDSMLIPLTAIPGQTRMRIAMRYLDPPPLCGEFVNGEVEEYCVMIDKLISREDPIKPVFQIYPNPAFSTIKVESEEFFQHIQVWSIQGKLLKEIELLPSTQFHLPLEGLASGIYVLRVNGNRPLGKELFVKH